MATPTIKLTQGTDSGIWLIAGFLAIISLLTSISTQVWAGHLPFLIAAGVLMWIFSKINYQKLSIFSNIGLLLAFALLLFTRVTGGFDARSIEIGSHQIQTMYFIGFLLTFYLSKYLAVKINNQVRTGEEITLRESIIQCIIISIICAGIFTSKQSTGIILFLICTILLLLGGVKFKYITSFIGICLILVLIIVNLGLFRSSTLENRISYWWTGELSMEKITDGEELTPAELKEREKYYKAYGEQMVYSQAMIARASWFPTKVGQAYLKDEIPAGKNDYVFAVIVEEFGILVGIFVLSLYLFLLFRAIRIAQRSVGIFAKLLATSIGLWISLLAIVHIAVNSGMMPATGETLPLISNGGMGIVFTGILLGILLNISKYSEKKPIKHIPNF